MLGYRSLFTTEPSADLELQIDSQLLSWLKSKGCDVDVLDLSVTGRTEVADQKFVEVVRPAARGSSTKDGTLRRVRFVEGSGWVTELTTEHPSTDDPWVWLEIHSPGDPWTGTPYLIRNLLASLEARDSTATLRDKARVVRADEVDDLLEVVCDPARRGLAFVAGSDTSLPWDPWQRQVDSLLRDTVGVASAYLLDPAATEAWERLISRSHSVPAGTIRTYLPEADPADRTDGRRHRFLGAARIAAGGDGQLRRRLARAARAQLQDQPLPPRFTRVDRLLRRLNTEALVARIAEDDDVHVLPHATPNLEQQTVLDHPLRLLIRDLVGTDQVTKESIGDLERLARRGRAALEAADMLRQRMLDMHTQIERLQDTNASLTRQRDDEQLNYAEQIDIATRLDDKVRYLQRELSDAGLHQITWSDVPETERTAVPAEFAELFDRLGELPNIVMSGDRQAAFDLEEHDQIGNIAAKAWLALLALDDYANARLIGNFQQGVHPFLQNAPEGCHSFSANRHAAGESESVKDNARLAQARVFPVPTAIDARGEVFMGAHFKLGAKGTLSPRLYYLDATKIDGHIYVGYIGKHLPNTRTN